MLQPSRAARCAWGFGLASCVVLSACHEAPSEARGPKPVAEQAQTSAFDALLGSEPLETVWTAPPQVVDPSEPAGPTLTFTRIALSPQAVAFDLQHTSGGRPLIGHPSEVKPRLGILLDGCPIDLPAYEGLLRFEGPAGRMALARRQLPKGDLEITFSAFDAVTMMQIRHDEEGIRPISTAERKGYRETEGDPENEIAGTSEVDDAPDCPATARRPAFTREIAR